MHTVTWDALAEEISGLPGGDWHNELASPLRGDENIGLVAVRVEATGARVTVAGFYLALEGLDLSDGDDARNNLKLMEFEGG